MQSAEERSYIWLDSFDLDAAFKNLLVEAAGGAANLVRGFAGYKEKFAQKGKVDLYEKMQETLQGDSYYKGLQSLYKKEGIVCVTRATDGYFSAWKELPDAPCVLYVKGDVRLIKTRIFTVVGSRKIRDAYRKTGEEICEKLARHFTLLTGVAEGGDEAAATGGLKGGKVLCMLAGGFGEEPKDGGDFLQKVAKKGAVLSVCPYGSAVRNYSYERRNKLMAALGEGVLVLSAGEKSGALKTAAYAKAFGKKIFALPYPPGDATGAGCNDLIKKGGVLTENLIDISSHFGINLNSEKVAPILTDDESRAYERLKDLGETHLGALSEALGLPVFKVSAVLQKLEVKGLVAKVGGNKYLAK